MNRDLAQQNNSLVGDSRAITIAIAESNELRRLGYQEILAEDSSLRVSTVTSDQIMAQPTGNFVLLLGGRGRGQGGLFERIALLRRQHPEMRILVASSHGDDETIVRCIQAGAKGYLDEACSIAELLQAVHIVAQGSIWAPRRLLSMFIERILQSPPGTYSPGKVDFTAREREVLELLVAGYSNREIATSLRIEERTVKAHVAKLLRKVGVANRIALTMHTISHALLSPP